MSELNREPGKYEQLHLDSQLCFPLYAAARRVVNEYNPLLKPFGLTYTRCRCKVDERVVYVSLTDAGWALREDLKVIPEKVGKCVTMKQEDAAALYTLLHRLLDAMQ